MRCDPLAEASQDADASAAPRSCCVDKVPATNIACDSARTTETEGTSYQICEVHATTCSIGDLDDDSAARVNEVDNNPPPSSQVLPRAVSVRLNPLPNATP